MKTYNAENRDYEINKEDSQKAVARVLPYGKIFLFFALGLGVVALLGFGWPWFVNTITKGDEFRFYTFYLASLFISFIGILVLSFVIQIKAFRQKSIGMSILYFLNAIFWGIFLSSVFMSVVQYTGGDVNQAQLVIGEAFAITGGAMLVMGIIGIIWKNISIIIPFLVSLLFGVFIISFVNIFTGSLMLYWITDFVILGIVLLDTAIDINSIKKLVDAGYIGSDNNLAIYAAYRLLSDFVIILIRILPYILISRKN